MCFCDSRCVFPILTTTWLLILTPKTPLTISDFWLRFRTPKTPLTIPDFWLRYRIPKTPHNISDFCTIHWISICFIIWTLALCIPVFVMTGSVRSCCVPRCGSTRADSVVLHGFPDPTKEKERFLTWVNAVGSSISSLDYEYIYKNRKICHNHFEKKYLTWSRKLSCDAVPTLGMSGFQVLRDVTNIHRNEQENSVESSSNTQAFGSTNLQPMIAESPMLETIASTSSANVMKSFQVLRDVTNIHRNEQENSVESSSNTQAFGSTNLQPMIAENPMLETIASTSSANVMKRTAFNEDKKVLALMLKRMVKKKDSYAARLKKAMILSENSTFKKMISKFTILAKTFLSLQFREVAKHKMGRRFTEEEKIMALSLYKQGPRCYRFLRKAFVLPSPLTLSRLIAQADLRPGLNENVFKFMKKKANKLAPDDKLCILIFDEMAIAPHLDYNSRKDEISGFINNGFEKQNKICDHALVFMIRGVLRNYKQPVAYTFCSGSTKKEELGMLIKEIIRNLNSVGFKVLATVCDQGASNVSCIHYLINETRAECLRKNKEFRSQTFEVDGEEVIPLFDPPHLIKGIRNNLLEKNLKCTIDGQVKVAKWEHIIKLYEEDPAYGGIRLVKKLTEDHINPKNCKMKVKFATQIFSQRVGSTMGYFATKNILPEECKQTADVLLFFDELFDSVNGSKENAEKRSGKPLLNSLTPDSIHSEIWNKAKPILSTMRFLKNGKEFVVPSVSNWLHTINNFEYLRDVLFNKYKVKSIWTRHFNQDPLENFFGAIRAHGSRNINPTPDGFENAYASLLINNLSGSHYSPGQNCEIDLCETLYSSLKEIFKSQKTSNTSRDIDLSYMSENIFIDFKEKTKDPRILSQLEYVTGYILRKTKKNVFSNCTTCKKIFFSSQKNCEYLKTREFDKKKQYLMYPKTEFVMCFSQMQDILMWTLKNHSNVKYIKEYAKLILSMEINMDFNNCESHKTCNTEYIFDLVCKFFIFNWCKDVNNILKGRLRYAKADDIIKINAVEYCNKRKKK